MVNSDLRTPAHEPLAPALLLRLQRQAGNQAVLRLLRAVQQPSAKPMAAVPEVEDRVEQRLEPSAVPNETRTELSPEAVPHRSWWRRLRDWLS